MKNQFLNTKHFQPQKRQEQDTSATVPDADAAASPSVDNAKPTGSGLRPPLLNTQKQEPLQENIYQVPGSGTNFRQMQQGPGASNALSEPGFFPGRLPTNPGSQPMSGGAPTGPSQPPSSFVNPNAPSFPPVGPRPSGQLQNNSMPGFSGPPPSFANPNAPGFPPVGPRPSGQLQNNSMSGFPGPPPFANPNAPGFPPTGPRPSGQLQNNSMSGFPPAGPPPFANPNAPGFPPAGPRPSGQLQNNSMYGATNPWQGPGYPQAMNSGRMPGEMAYQQRGTNNFGPPPMGPTAPGKDRRKKRRFPIWARVLVATLAVLLIVPGILYGYYQLNYADAVNSITGQKAIHHVNIIGSTPQANNGGTPSGNRVNILLLGSDDDGKNGNNGVGGSPLAQTDLVITIDPQSKYIGELSIPRDLQVTIPGQGIGKMDFAFSYGYQQQHSSDKNLSTASAAALAEDTIAYNYGIHIDYYAWVGLTGFVKVIDTAGGVDIDILHPVLDDTYPDDVNNPNNNAFAYTRLYIAPGPQHMNGVQALNYVRTRHADLGADFARTIKQQQLLSQLKTKLATPDTITKAPALLADLKGFLQTDMTPSQIINMANFARGTDTNKIEHITLSPPTYSTAGLSGGNFAPICSQVKIAVAKMFAIQPKCISQFSLASTTPSTAPALAMTPAVQQPTSTALSSLDPGTHVNTTNNFTGIHSLLDLMFIAVFGSFNAAKV